MQRKEEFVKIIKENAGLIYKVTRVYTDSREDRQDLYQEIVYQLWKSFESFRSESKVSTWMYRIALNTAIAHLNKEKKKGSYTPIDELLLNKPDLNDTLKEEQIEILYTQIRRLDKIEKGIILLYLDGKTYDEIAGITGFSTTNIGTRLGRIKQKLIAQIN
ncbi:RNA polymerase sigma factor [Mucilaginibacter xinganensis]|uniref:RNA polymerase subunit sigma-70 n=1 Tax=Mucilaginibacter xinganensis TaxID=1234841 RepID=A0A223NSC9_9SPHI|nr:sigma-70 family RNA polymerase sigma factor [Mucilaginibacter xinganensis]ASU32809.1 RNA polymerase subunit sigma-70 [Mucilaginibacter xinganensis]